MPHQSHLQQSLRALLAGQRIATLGVQPIADFSQPQALPGPGLSCVPWAWDSQFCCLIIHVSALASHTQAMEQHPAVSLMVVAAEHPGSGVHALEHVSIQGIESTPPPNSLPGQAAKASYLQRFPEAEGMTMLCDFRFVCITPTGARHIAGFGAARGVDDQELIATFNPVAD